MVVVALKGQNPPEGALTLARGENFSGPNFKGHGTTDMVCGHCGAVVSEGVSPTGLGGRLTGYGKGIILQCDCGTFNAVPGLGTY